MWIGNIIIGHCDPVVSRRGIVDHGEGVCASCESFVGLVMGIRAHKSFRIPSLSSEQLRRESRSQHVVVIFCHEKVYISSQKGKSASAQVLRCTEGGACADAKMKSPQANPILLSLQPLSKRKGEERQNEWTQHSLHCSNMMGESLNSPSFRFLKSHYLETIPHG